MEEPSGSSLASDDDGLDIDSLAASGTMAFLTGPNHGEVLQVRALALRAPRPHAFG
jgi:hypothetical protein